MFWNIVITHLLSVGLIKARTHHKGPLLTRCLRQMPSHPPRRRSFMGCSPRSRSNELLKPLRYHSASPSRLPTYTNV